MSGLGISNRMRTQVIIHVCTSSRTRWLSYFEMDLLNSHSHAGPTPADEANKNTHHNVDVLKWNINGTRASETPLASVMAEGGWRERACEFEQPRTRHHARTPAAFVLMHVICPSQKPRRAGSCWVPPEVFYYIYIFFSSLFSLQIYLGIYQ